MDALHAAVVVGSHCASEVQAPLSGIGAQVPLVHVPLQQSEFESHVPADWMQHFPPTQSA